MQHALGLSAQATTMFAIMLALGVAGLAALFMALFWPARWRMSYRVEVVFALVLVALAVYADVESTDTYRAYEASLPGEAIAGTLTGNPNPDAFDRAVTVYAYQWGFLFFDEEGRGARNAVAVQPGERVLFNILSNDVIHGFDVPAARMITEVDPGGVRSVWIKAPDQPGKYLIQCVDYCGVGHHQMKAWLVVEEAQADVEPDMQKHG